MKSLCIETTTEKTSVALIHNNQVYHHTDNAAYSQSEKIFSVIDCVLKKAALDINQIENFFCTNGPGSFIGIRVGHSILKCIKSIRNDVNVFGISNMQLLYSQFDLTNSRVALNAKKDMVFVQDFTKKKPASKISLISREKLQKTNNLIIDQSLRHLIKTEFAGKIDALKLAEFVRKNSFDKKECGLNPMYIAPLKATPPKKLFDL
ncbi:MAG: tRNA (adenosine(37)-N6)-threonylcarbamoyltransferase complex dimerization subunit type 1 TsaB [Rickettsiales bacterium]